MVMETGYAVESDHRQMKQSKKKKPGFVKRWFAKMSREAWEEEKSISKYESDIRINNVAAVRLGGPSIDQPDRSIQFTVYSATGGRIIETRRYDKRTDRNTNGLYIITNDQDFGKEVDKIITMESLRS
jgi:hypothetical protein